MMSLTTRIYMIEAGAVESAVGSGDPTILRNALEAAERMDLPKDVIGEVLPHVRSLIEKGAQRPQLDLVRALGLVAILRAVGEEFEIDTLEAVPGVQSVFRAMGEAIDYNLDAHLFGNPPPPFQAIDSAGTPIDIGYMDADEIDELLEVLEGLDLSEDEIEEFLDDHGLELLEDLVEPLSDAVELARRSARELVFITEG